MSSPDDCSRAWLAWPSFWQILGSVCLPVTIPWLIFQYLNSLKFKVMQKKLEGKVVLITGASSGLGEALAHSFYKAGCKLILASRREAELERVRVSLLQMHQTSPTYPPVVLPLDLADIDNLPKQAKKALSIFGHIDILINNGGISNRGGVLATNIDVDMKIMLVNYFGLVALTKAILPSMVQRKEGHIVAISSVQGLLGIPYRSAYAASKHALQGFCDSLRAEVACHNIKVTVISPGYIRTKLSINALTSDGKQYGVMDTATAEGYEPEAVADISLKAVIQEKKELLVSPLAPKLAYAIRHMAPWLYFRIMEMRAKKMATSVVESNNK